MEDILASIRRIIADDQSMPRLLGEDHQPVVGALSETPASTEPVVPERGGEHHAEAVAAPEHAHADLAALLSSAPPPLATDHDTSSASPMLLAPPEPAAVHVAAAPEPNDEDAMSGPDTEFGATRDSLFSPTTDHSITAAFNTLAVSRIADNSEELMTLAREMIRPLLRTWIDDNVPGMVERLVKAEIERMTRGGR